jgi:DNA repair protein RadC
MNLFNQILAEVKVSYSHNVKFSEMKKISSSHDVYQLMADNWPVDVDHREAFVVVLLNRANKVLGFSVASLGGISGTVADPKLIYQVALKSNATSIILVHNHPSGSVKPSDADIKLTRKLKNAGEMLDLPVLDHLILGSEKYYSFADEGVL